MPVIADQVLPVVRVGEIRSEESAQRWLVEELWGASSVGVIGGAPKCAKTWLGLDMALSVATGTACLGKYAVPQPGPVLVYLAEDALLVVRERVAGMARHRGLDLAGVDIHVITAPTLRLDRGADRTRLLETTRRLRPRLLLLDPLVRLHGIDENNAGEVAELLAYFRSLQRQLDLSVLLVHHTRKNAAGGVAAGQGLRGSGDIHAFGDSNLYLRRTRDHLVLSKRAPRGARVGTGLPGSGRDQRGDDSPGGRRGAPGREATRSRRASPRPSAPRRSADTCQAPRFTGGQERALGRSAGVAGAHWPALPHTRRLATPELIV
jgi:AAA domain